MVYSILILIDTQFSPMCAKAQILISISLLFVCTKKGFCVLALVSCVNLLLCCQKVLVVTLQVVFTVLPQRNPFP